VTVSWQGSYTPSTLQELIQALCLESSAGRLTFRSGTQMASLYLFEGQLTDAHYKSLRGLEALAVLLGFEDGEYRFVSGLRSENQNLNGDLSDLILQASTLQEQAPRSIQQQATPNQAIQQQATPNQATPIPSTPSSSLPNLGTPVPSALVNPSNAAFLPASFFHEILTLLNDLRIVQPNVVLTRAITGLGQDLSSIPKSRVLELMRNLENEIAPHQAKTLRQSMVMTLDTIRAQLNQAETLTINPEPRPTSTPTIGLRTVAATLLGRIPGPILSSIFIGEIRQTLEQLRVLNAETAIDRAAENLGFYPTEIPSSQTKKFLTAIISEITNEQGYQFQQLLETTVREFEGQTKANKAPSLADRAISFPTFSNPLAARAKAVANPVDPAFEFTQSIQQNLKNIVPPSAVNALIQAAANDLGIQASDIAPGYAQKFVQAISQHLDVETAQKFQRTMALSVGVYTAQR
jgi:Domain of unknown function (DUF4388)